MTRRLAGDKTKKEVMRWLKRYLAREIFSAISHSPAAAQALSAVA
jgi:hypothetical protein